MEQRKHKHPRGSLGIPLRWWTVIGAVLAFLAFGSCYCWGTITIYVTSYVRKYEPDTTYDETMAVYAGALIAQASTMWTGGLIEKRIGPRLTLLLGGYIFTAGVLLSALATSTWGLVFTYGVFTGAGIGVGYAAPLMCAMKNFPKREGMVAGIVVAGFGFGAVIWNQVATVYVNPKNESLDDNGDDDEYYSEHSSVSKRVPSMFLLLGACYFVMFTVGCLLLHEPEDETATATGTLDAKIADAGAYQPLPNPEEDDEEVTAYVAPSEQDDTIGSAVTLLDSTQRRQFHPKELLVYPLFYLVILSFVATVVSGLIVSLTYKTYGADYWDDDHFLSMVGSVAAAFSTIGRMGWGKISDLVGNKRAMQLIAIVFIVLLATYPFTTVNRMFYAFWTWLILSCYGGNFAIYPATVKILFGEKYASANYGLTFLGFGYVTVIIIMTISYMHVSFTTLCMISMALTIFGLGCLTMLPKF